MKVGYVDKPALAVEEAKKEQKCGFSPSLHQSRPSSQLAKDRGTRDLNEEWEIASC